MKFTKCAVAVALMAIFGAASAAPNDARPAGQPIAAAEAALRNLSVSLADQDGTLPAGFPLEVSDVQDLKRATIGFGYEELQADPNALLAGKSLESAARSTGTWRYTVELDGHAIGLLTMANVGGRWDMVGIGGARLSQDIGSIIEQTPKGANVRVIRVLQAAADFVEVKGVDQKARFAPLEGARLSLGLKRSIMVPDAALLDESAFGQQLRDSVSRNINN